MNAHGQSHPQGLFPGSMPSQQQNMGAPRGAPNPAQTTAKQPNFAGARGQYALANEHLLDPQVSLWTIAKPIQTTSWDDVEPEQLCVSKQDIMRRMAKFHKKGEDPADVLINIRSQNARKAVNELVEQQNERLWEYNPTIYYYIASIQVDKEIIKCWPAGEKKRIKRIDVILKTEPRPHHEIPKAFLDAMQPPKQSSGGKDSYSSQGGVGQGGAQGPKGNQGGNPGQNNNMPPQGVRGPQGPGPNNGPSHNQSHGPPQGQFNQPGPHGGIPPPPPPPTNGPPQNQNHGPPQGQFNQPGGPGGNIPPPPPPPNGQFGAQGHGGGIPPPPPPAPGPPRQPQAQTIPPPPPHQMPQQVRTMPGAFPGTNNQPRVEVLDQRTLDSQKAKSKGRHDPRDSSESDSESLSDVSVEEGFSYVARSRSRGGGLNDYRRSRSRSLNRGHTRNRSRDRNNITKNYKDQRYGRTRSDIESPHRPRHSNNTSPNSSNPAIQPQNIFNIKIDNDNERAKKKGRDGHRRARDPLRTTNSTSPPHFPPNPYRGQDKYAAEAMYRSSSNNGSDSESSYAGTSSIYTESDRSIFSEPEHHYTKQVPFRPPPHMQHSRDDGFARPLFDYDPRGAAKHHYPGPNDYPAQRTGNSSPKYDDHIMPPRRHGQQNPFEASPRYPGGYSGYGHEQAPPRYLTEREDDQELSELAYAFIEKMQQRRHGHPGRRQSARMSGGLGAEVDTDEWANPRERFENGHPRYSGFRHV